MSVLSDLRVELRKFDEAFDVAIEEEANNARGEFIRAFPPRKLALMELDDYVIGKGTPTFCTYVEPRTAAWAKIMGATAFKFGVYYGRTKSESEKKYRYTEKFGQTATQAFKAVKMALLKLINDGKAKNFAEIDANPLSQMFKAKILSLYFPGDYINICSYDSLETIADELGLPNADYYSELQHLIVREKNKDSITRKWSNPRFMNFVFDEFIRSPSDRSTRPALGVPQKRRKKVNFEEIDELRRKIGKKAEECALEWERNRLLGAGLQKLISKIEDRRDIPSYGYDFLSYSAPNRERYIEVKAVGRDWVNSGYRFFLSENEHSISRGSAADNYFFYLVFFGSNAEPEYVRVERAKDMYSWAELSASSYIVRFNVLH